MDRAPAVTSCARRRRGHMMLPRAGAQPPTCFVLFPYYVVHGGLNGDESKLTLHTFGGGELGERSGQREGGEARGCAGIFFSLPSQKSKKGKETVPSLACRTAHTHAPRAEKHAAHRPPPAAHSHHKAKLLVNTAVIEASPPHFSHPSKKIPPKIHLFPPRASVTVTVIESCRVFHSHSRVTIAPKPAVSMPLPLPGPPPLRPAPRSLVYLPRQSSSVAAVNPPQSASLCLPSVAVILSSPLMLLLLFAS